METWLRDHLIRNGHMAEGGATRRARLRVCRSCGEHVLNGLDGIVCAFDTYCDPIPLSAFGEAVAVMQGRHTYAVHSEGGRYVLDPRDGYQIAWSPAASKKREDVLRQHRCGSDPPTGDQVTASSFAEVAPPLPADAAPPF